MEESAGPAFGIDIIKSSIKGLQEEKERNERKLSEARTKRRRLENKYETALSKFNQASDTKSKIADTLKVALYKVDQSQAAIEGQQRINHEVKQRNSHLKDGCKTEETNQQEERELLEGKLASLTELFHQGKVFYVDKSLQDEIGVAKNEMQNNSSKAHQIDLEAERLVGVFEAMEIVAKKHQAEMGLLQIPLETQHQILELFEQDVKFEEKEFMELKQMEQKLLAQLEE